MAQEKELVVHPLEPVFNRESRVLILGTMPSPASRNAGFYYGHPHNRFWRVLSELLQEPLAVTNEARKEQLLKNHIALWDVLVSCEITGASDSSITNAVPNDLSRILDHAPIQAIFCSGSKAYELYHRFSEPLTGLPATKLPSTSPANATMTLDKLVNAWRCIML
ncbi:MAG: DNA-deoxyinosine glycosylase [Coriobacteriales bacterium]|nr:DNA-deoxyinosine glycosylase [Coriobacteriales bacterium]